MNVNCYFGFHKWAKWGKLIEQVYVSYGSPLLPTQERKHLKLAQERECNACGMKQRRMVK